MSRCGCRVDIALALDGGAYRIADATTISIIYCPIHAMGPSAVSVLNRIVRQMGVATAADLSEARTLLKQMPPADPRGAIA